jgi:hypothetical protein
VSARSNLNRLIASSAMSNLADGMLQITLPLVTLGITRDPGAFASVTSSDASRGCCSRSTPAPSRTASTDAAR